jgi:hypothetical protein
VPGRARRRPEQALAAPLCGEHLQFGAPADISDPCRGGANRRLDEDREPVPGCQRSRSRRDGGLGLREPHLAQGGVRRELVLDPRQRAERRDGGPHTRGREALLTPRQHGDLLLSREQHVEALSGKHGERCVQPSEWVGAVRRHAVHAPDTAREPGQCHAVRRQHVDRMTGREELRRHLPGGQPGTVGEQYAHQHLSFHHRPGPRERPEAKVTAGAASCGHRRAGLLVWRGRSSHRIR